MASILVVEDDALIRLGIVALLKAEGHCCHQAATAADAIALARTLSPDLMLLDWNLADGSSAREIVTAVGAVAPVILASGTATAAEAAAVGALALLPKPFASSALRTAVAKALDPARAHFASSPRAGHRPRSAALRAAA